MLKRTFTGDPIAWVPISFSGVFMDTKKEIEKYQRIIKMATVILVVAQAVLLGLFFTDIITKTVFQYVFAGVFVVYALLATMISLAIGNAANRQ